MFKIFKPNRRKWESKQTPSSMPHRTHYFDFKQISKSKESLSKQKAYDFQSLNQQTSRFLHSSTSRSSNRLINQNSQNIQSLLKRTLQDKTKIYSSQKSLRKKQSTTQRNLEHIKRSTLNFMDFKKNPLMKINLGKFRNTQPRRDLNNESRLNDLRSSQSSRKSGDQSCRLMKNLAKKNLEMKQTSKIQNSQTFSQQSFLNSGTGGKSQYCTIIIVLEKNQTQNEISVRYKVKKIESLIKFLKNYIKQFQEQNQNKTTKEIVSFQTVDYNLQLDYYLTLLKQDGSFLNGQTIALRPVYAIKQTIVTLNSFEIIQCIGSGGFSNVYLCRFKQNGKFYAMKVISKAFIVKHQKKKIIMNQRNIMVQLRDKINIAKLNFAFQSKDYIIFVMEYYEGGQLFNLVKKVRKMDQKTARFYMTEILIGLEQIHDHNIVYRDFKPENIMIDMEGHAYIADFGLAKPDISTMDDRAYSFCGSPQYMPPEMIMKDGHSLPVDFYCLGALLYELVTGLPPFYNTDPQRIYEGTLNQELTFPDHAILSSQLEDLLQSLLCKDQKYRLGSTFGVQEVLSHPWFKSIKKQDFKQKKIKPPFNFKRIQDLRFNIDEMQQENQNQMKEILNNQKLQVNSKYLKIMNGFYYDYRLEEQGQSKQNQIGQENTAFKKQKINFSVQKQKNNSSSIALTNCTRRSQNSLILGNKIDENMKNLLQQGLSLKQNHQRQKTDFHSKQKSRKESLKSVQKRLFSNLNNFLV